MYTDAAVFHIYDIWRVLKAFGDSCIALNYPLCACMEKVISSVRAKVYRCIGCIGIDVSLHHYV